MDKQLKTGISYTIKQNVSQEDSAINFQSGNVNVFSTPKMIAIMEKASMLLADECLENGTTTVGVEINVKHLAATPIGVGITVISTLVEIDRKRLIFDVEAHDEFEKIGYGTHERFIIDSEKFMQKIDAKKNIKG